MQGINQIGNILGLEQQKLNRQQGALNDDQQMSSSDTQQLHRSKQQKIHNLKPEKIYKLSSLQKTQQNKKQTNKQKQKQLSKKLQIAQKKLQISQKSLQIDQKFVQCASYKQPQLKGDKIYIKEGQVYYRTATKFFQPQKHYLHKQESSIIKTWLYGNGKTTDQFLISSWNINGIRNALHKSSVCDYIKNTNPDILCMIEVKINEWNYRKRPVKLPGYQGYWNFCKCSSGYSGIAIFSKFQPIAAFQDFEERQFSQQGRVLTLEFQLFYLVAAYIPTAGQNLQRLDYKVNHFQKIFYKHCTKLLNKKHVIVAGDLNVCHTVLDMHVPKIIRKHQGKHPSSTKKEKMNFESFLNAGFVDTFRRMNPGIKKYSWYNIKRLGREKNLGKRLDYFLVNQQFMGSVIRSEVLSEMEGSDHCPIELNVDLRKLSAKDESIRNKKTGIREQYIKRNFIPQQRFISKKIQQKQFSSVEKEQERIEEVQKQDIL